MNLATALIACDVETRLLRPTQQLGRDAAWMHGDIVSLQLVHGFGTVPVRYAPLTANKAQPRGKTETGWTIRRTTDEGFLSADRKRGAA